MGKTLLALDIATCTGFAVFDVTSDARLMALGTVSERKPTKRAPHTGDVTYINRPWSHGASVLSVSDSYRGCWAWVLGGYTPDVLVREAVHVQFKGAAMALSERHGQVMAYLRADEMEVAKPVPPSEWRRVIGEKWGYPFPSDTERCKELAVKIVKDKFKLDCVTLGLAADAAEAALQGVYYAVTSGLKVVTP